MLTILLINTLFLKTNKEKNIQTKLKKEEVKINFLEFSSPEILHDTKHAMK